MTTAYATSDDGEVRLVATFYDGCPLDARYLDRYARYRRRPTRVRPPVPSEYPAVYVTLFERGRPARAPINVLPASRWQGCAKCRRDAGSTLVARRLATARRTS